MRKKSLVTTGDLGAPVPVGPRLGATESLVIVVVIALASALVACGMSTVAALELLSGAGLLGVHVVRQARA